MHCRVAELYEFHLQTKNAARIMPPGLSLIALQAPSVPQLHVPMQLNLLILGFLPQTWVVEWEVMEPPHGQPEQSLLVDRTLRGPFPFFRHHHRFFQERNLSRLTDEVHFQPPFRPLGWLFLPFIYLAFHLLFTWRQSRTKTLLEAAAAL